MNDPIDKITKAASSIACRSRDQFIYALYLATSMEDLCSCYFKYLNETGTRNEIVRHIKIKKDKKGEVIPNAFIGQLLNEFKTSDKNRRIWLGTTLKELQEDLTSDQLKEFIECQVLSERVLDRKRAYVVATHKYDKEIDELLWKSWHKYNDNNCMGVLVNNTDVRKLAENFESIWNSENLKFYIKNNVLKRVAKCDFKKVSFLEKEKPVSYLSACVASEKQITDEAAISIVKSSDSIGSIGYCLWCLGMLGKHKALYQILGDINKIEENLPTEFWEYPR